MARFGGEAADPDRHDCAEAMRRLTMQKFITIGYGDQAGYDRTSPPIRDAAHEQDAILRSKGALIGIAGAPVQVRNPAAAKVETRDGSFMSSELPIAGFAVIEATDLADAIEKVPRVPCAVAHDVLEIWPLRKPRSFREIYGNYGKALSINVKSSALTPSFSDRAHY